MEKKTAAMKRNNRFLRNAFFGNLMPIMLSVLGGTVNALIDSILVSQIVGPDAMTAINISMPVYLLLCTIGALIGSGACTLAAQAIGKGKLDEAAAHYHAANWLWMVCGAVITAAGVLLSRPVSTLLSHGAAMEDLVYRYVLVTFLGAGVNLAISVPASFLQLDGKSRSISVMFCIIISVDVVFDLLLMLVFPLGITGAAIASVLSMLSGVCYGYFALHHGHTNFPRGICVPKHLGKLLKFGSPAALGNLFDTVKLLTVNAVILQFYPEHAAAWAAINTLCELSLVIVHGVPRAGFPLIGAFYTSYENSGIRILIRLETIIGLVFSSAFAVLLAVLSGPIGLLFKLSEPMLIPCIYTGVSVILFTMCCIWENHFHAIGSIRLANLISSGRKLVFPVITTLALAQFHGDIWLFLPLSGLLALGAGFLMTDVPYVKNRKKVHCLSRFLLLDDYLEREQKVLDFSIAPDMSEVCSAAEQIQAFCVKNHMNARQAMRLELSIEELLSVVISRVSGMDSVDLRAYAVSGSAGLRVQYAGRLYDPFNDTEDEEFSMGITMLKKMADVCDHNYTLGMNHVNIVFPLEREA